MTDQELFDHLTALDNERQRATMAKEIDKVDAMLGSTFRYVHGSGTDEDRDLYMERLRANFYDYKDMQPIRREFRRFGDTVLVHGDMSNHVIINGTEKKFTGRYLQVWTLEDGQWKFVAWETTVLPQA